MAKILVVDDGAMGREFLVTLLSYYHHNLLEAGDGEEALQIIRKERPDLIITDILMPTIGGFELVQKIRSDSLLRDIPVIFYTGAYRVGDAALLAVNCGVKHVLSKPSDSALILETVNKALGEAAPEPKLKSVLIREDRKTFLTAENNKLKYTFPESKALIKQIETTLDSFQGLLRNLDLVHDRNNLIEVSVLFNQNITSIIKLNKQLIALFGLVRDIGTEENLKRLIQLFCEKSRNIIGAKYLALGILHDNPLKLKYYFELNTIGLLQEMIDFKPLHFDFINKLIINRETVLINDIPQMASSDLLFNPAIKNSLLGVPLIYGEHVFGFLYFADTPNGDPFNDLDLEVAGAIALLFAIMCKDKLLKGFF